jgi:deoxyribodipyrimidine photolyase-related protein
MWPTLRLAQEVGPGLGESQILLTTLSRRRDTKSSKVASRILMSALRIVLGDQLSFDISALAGLDPARDIVLMMEVTEESTYVPHHKQKIVLILSAMRHFAQQLRSNGVKVDYVKLDAPNNSGNLTAEMQRAVKTHAPDRLIATEAGEWRVQVMVESWSALIGKPVEVRADHRFFASHAISIGRCGESTRS